MIISINTIKNKNLRGPIKNKILSVKVFLNFSIANYLNDLLILYKFCFIPISIFSLALTKQ